MVLELKVPQVFLSAVAERIDDVIKHFNQLQPVTSIEGCPPLPPLPEGYTTWYTLPVNDVGGVSIELPHVYYISVGEKWNPTSRYSHTTLRHIFVLPEPTTIKPN